MKLTKRQRENISKITGDICKLTFGAIVIGKFVTATGMPLWVFIGGSAVSAIMFLIAIFVDKGE